MVSGAAACEQGFCVGVDHRPLDGTTSPMTDADGAPDGSPMACDPLAPHELPITLRTLLGAGKDSAGTVYVADQDASAVSSSTHLFVSMGDTLYRRRITGSGESSSPPDGTDYNFSFDDGIGQRSLLIQRRGGITTSMAVGDFSGKEVIGDAGPTSGALTLIDSNEVMAFKLKNLPGEVTIEYVADVENGNVIVVTHPRDDSTYADFRLFYGPQSALVEYPVLGVMRTRSSNTSVPFTNGNAQAVADFTWVLQPNADGGTASHPGPATLDLGDGVKLAVTQQFPTPTNLAGYSFTCLR